MDTSIRLAACGLVRTRFSGRAAMEREASRDLVALARLEVRLGLADEGAVLEAEREAATEQLRHHAGWGSEGQRRAAVAYLLAGDDHAARERFAARCYASLEDGQHERRIARIAAPAAVDAIDRLRRDRAARQRPQASYADRRPRHAEGVITLRRAEEQIRRADFHTASHDHTRAVRLVPEGEEEATSTSGKMSSRAAGMSQAYCRQAYSVATSHHEFSVSRAMLSPATRALNAADLDGALYLSPCTRVVQGRGTGLRVEHLTARGAWK